MDLTRKQYAIDSVRGRMDLKRDFKRKVDNSLRGTQNNSLSDEQLIAIVNKAKRG